MKTKYLVTVTYKGLETLYQGRYLADTIPTTTEECRAQFSSCSWHHGNVMGRCSIVSYSASPYRLTRSQMKQILAS